MDGRFNSNPFVRDQEEPENSPENSGDSRSPPLFNEGKISSSTSSPKRRSVGELRYPIVIHIFLFC